MEKTITSRKVLTRSGRRVRYLYPSKKNRAQVQCESRLEFDAAMHFEFSTNIKRYREQPVRVTYRDREGEVRIYFPDFELTMTDGTIVHIEIKPSAKLRNAVLRARMEDIAEHYARLGLPFRIMTEQDFRTGTRISTLEHLTYHSRQVPSGFRLSELMGRLAASRPLNFAAACSIAGSPQMVMRLLAAGYLGFDDRQRLVDSSPLEVRVEGQT